MSNLTQENQNQQKEGEIFKNPEESAYQAAITPEISSDNLSSTSEEAGNISEEQQSFNEGPSNGDSFSGENPPPIFFEEDKKKKILIALLSVLFLFFLIFLGISLLKGKPPKTQESITLTYWGLWEEKEIIQPVIDDYQKSHPHLTINYLKQDPKQYRERLQAAIERGEGPDIFRFHNSWVPMLINYLSPLPKNIYSDEEYKKTFYPVVIKDLRVGNNFYGIPLEIDGLLLFYNEEILKSANVPVPLTWVDVQNAVPKLTVKEKNRIITSAIALGTAENIEHFSDILSLMMLQNGTQLAKSLFSCNDSASTNCAVEALAFYRKFAESPHNTWDETLENSILAFATGKVAMILAPSWQVFTIKKMAENTNLNFKTAPVPQLPCEREPCPSVNWATYWVEGVSNKSKYQAAAWEFLKYLSTPQVMQKLYSEQIKYRKFFGEPYSRVDMAKSLADNPYLAPLITSAPSMQSFYTASRTHDGETGLNSSLIKYLKDAVNSLSQGTSIETALKTVDNGFKQVFSRFNLSASSQ